MTYLPYKKRRPTSKAETGQKLVHNIFNELNWASDVAIIYSVRQLEKLLGLQDESSS